MGENEGWADTDGPLPNGLLPGAGPVMHTLDADRWLKAEERTAELIACIKPNQPSEDRRRAVADYVQRLIMQCFPCQVCTFGSVPLKTYLPDGDIDLTAFSQNLNLKDTWANQVRDMLEHEEKNENAEFHVKEVQYIQAEVKIIKCLVENIVVDISFNQVGGLCTLCFLDEVDNLINQNHLFKRSIILIKAWCYYESRILGAHHGLISTYALETLVLYIFHVFNNSFHGPLEVLYRFLAFFSNFDWDNFCVSLWGPVPISSLPDVSAEPPRKDSGELLLSKLFLDACSSVYAVFPGGQENNGQPFVSKHFNVIDPLRVNNNLGRSVSKGNFFRIRSAFAFGAKRLARLLDCPKEDLVFEVNQFFFNTWERHGSGHRPDAPGIDSRHLRLSTPDSPHEYENSKNNTAGKMVKENTSAHGKKASRMSELSSASHTHSVKSQFNLNSNISNQVLVNAKVQRDLKPDNLVNDTQGRFVFARTRSSPELTDSCGDVSTQVQRNRKAKTASEVRPTSSRPDSSSSRKNLGSDTRQVPSQQSLDPVIDSNSGSNSYQRDCGLDSNSISDEFMNQEEQDLVNMMTSTSLQGFNGHVPFGLPSGHLPYSMPPSFLASMGYNQRNLPGFVPINMPLMDPSFSHMQFPHGLISPQLTHYFPGVGLNSLSEDSVERSNENFSLHSGEGDDFLHEQDVGSDGGYDHENDNFDQLQSDGIDRPPASLPGLKYVPPPIRGSQIAKRVQQKHHPREKRVSVNIDSSQAQDFRSSEVYADERPASSRFSSATHSNSLRSRTSSESSWDGSSMKTSKSTKEKRGTKIVSADLAASHGKGKTMSDDYDDDDQESGSLTEIADRHPGPVPIAPLQVPRAHMRGFEVAQTSGSDSVMPFGPMLIGPSSKQRTNDNSGLIAFYPTGPPIPFLTMLPVYNVPQGAGTADASSSHFGGDETLDNSESNFSQEGFNQLEDLNSLRGSINIDRSEEHKPDILNSDFASHWQNLQFGRFCQNPPYHGPLIYPSPMMVPPVYVQGRFPHDNHGRPVSTNTNIFSQLMTSYGHHVVPVAPLQSVSSRPPNIYQPYVDEMPRYRSGTGTYLPNPKVTVRERHSPGSRRGNYNRNDSFADRDSNWNASKSRGGGRIHNRSQTDKSDSRTDRYTSSESRSDRSWNSHRHESIPSYQSQNGPLRSNSSQNGPQNVAYTMYPLAATNPNGVSNGSSGQPLMMLYPFDRNANYGPSEQLEFGSFGQVGVPGINEQSQINEGTRVRSFEENRLHGSSVLRSSPDQPSSPHQQRRAS